MALKIGANALGGFMSSRLMRKLRVDLSLVYGVDTNFDVYENNKGTSVCFYIETSTSNDKIKKVLQLILKEIHNFQQNKFTLDEVNISKNYLLGNFEMDMEKLDELVSHLTSVYFNNNKKTNVNETKKIITSISKNEVNKVLNEILNIKNMKILVISSDKIK